MVAIVEPDWPRHPRVGACFTTRTDGASAAPYDSFNLAHHVGDDPAHVADNRRRLRSTLELRHEPAWLDQVHGVRVAQAGQVAADRCADASWTGDREGPACAILTADCLPILLADDDGTCVAAAHAGWRGLATGVLESTVLDLPVLASRLSAWLGPAIGPRAFEVGAEVRDAFVNVHEELSAAFRPGAPGKFFGDLFAIARWRLGRLGIVRVYGGDRCTYSEPEAFFSFRRERVCGRMAALVWLR
ncbi:MAG: peptidoglycan editing factor PgeF [Panacagrimonas sp.]